MTIDGAVIASGEVAVQFDLRPVQRLKQCIVQEIKVKNRDLVEARQVVLQLDPKLAEINRGVVHGVLTEPTARKVQREAERLKLDEMQPIETEIALDPDAVQGQLQGRNEALKPRRAVLESRKVQLREQIQQQ